MNIYIYKGKSPVWLTAANILRMGKKDTFHRGRIH